MKLKITKYLLTCAGADTYVYSISLRASEKWLKQVLKRKELISGDPLTKKQFDLLRRRVSRDIEIGWCHALEYYLEGTTDPQPPGKWGNRPKTERGK